MSWLEIAAWTAIVDALPRAAQSIGVDVAGVQDALWDAEDTGGRDPAVADLAFLAQSVTATYTPEGYWIEGAWGFHSWFSVGARRRARFRTGFGPRDPWSVP